MPRKASKKVTKESRPRLHEATWYALLVKLSGMRASVTNFLRCEIGGDRDTGLVQKAIPIPDPPAARLGDILNLVEDDLLVCVEGLVSHARKEYPGMEIPVAAQWTRADKKAKEEKKREQA